MLRSKIKDPNQTIEFTRAECQLKISEPFLGRVKCKNVENTERAIFRNVPFAPDVYKIAIRVKKRDIDPFTEGQEIVEITMTTGAIDRPDVIGDAVPAPCGLRVGSSKQLLKCLEPSGF